MQKKPTVLMILDGFGLTDEVEGNAIKAAKTPNLDKLMQTYPWSEGFASGLAVGLPEGQMGNSEVGHTNMGAGRIVYQELTRITKNIQDGEFFNNEVLKNAVENCKKNNSALHIYGLLSDGGVHSHIEHLFGLLELAKRNNLTNVFVHVFLDGRDTPPASGISFIESLQNKMNELGVGKIATLSGRFYAMDRDNRWERVEKAYNAIALGEGEKTSNVIEHIKNCYDNGITDEFVVPTVVEENGKPVATVNDKDTIICYNFRPDRAREITRTFCDKDFSNFTRKKGFIDVFYVCFTEYDVTIENKEVVFRAEDLKNTLGEYISNLGLNQLRLAETEKYAHVTFFFNGGLEKPYKNEDRILVNSPKVQTYDLQPEMSAFEVTDNLVNSIESLKYDLIVVNYANADMVGHTGDMESAIKAVEAVDTCVGRVVEALLKVDGQMFVCADHGNSDKLIDYVTKEPFTAHTTNPVPFIIVNCKKIKGIKNGGRLCDIAPTLLDMMDLEKPAEMTGDSLLVK